MNYLDDLNSKQKEAVLTTSGPLLILAGAGAGKTKTITHRILHLIHEGVDPRSILAITFTNKAAKEMRDRVLNLLSKDDEFNRGVSSVEKPFISTFHALGVHIIRENARLIGLTRHFTIFDRSDSRRAVKKAIEAIGLDSKQYEPNMLLSIISREKGDAHTLQSVRDSANGNPMREIVAKVWEHYETSLAREKALDFDDLLQKSLYLLETHTDVREYYRSLWKYIHIDEYQDTNRVQYSIAKTLVGSEENICVVGDIDQNIYSWRGADIKNILNFERDFKNPKIVILEENYRSTQTILSVANAVIQKNKNRFEKNLFSRGVQGEKVSIFEAFDENDEGRFIAEKCAELIGRGTDPDEIAVLYRANFQSRVLEDAFLSRDVPYQVLGTRFFERKEVKDVLSFLRAAQNRDSLSDIERVINVPARGLGKATVAKVFSGMESSLTGKTKDKWESFKALLDSIEASIRKDKTSEVVRFVIQASGLEKSLKDGPEEDQERLENVRELATLAIKYDFMPPGDGVEKLIEDAALASDQDEMEEKKKGAKLMTVHASKGLEFEYVFIAGLEQDLFPHRKMESKSAKRDDEEERRLFYVALTRAKKKIYASYANIRTIFGSRQIAVPSEFIFDMPEEFVDKEERFDRGEGKVIYFDI